MNNEEKKEVKLKEGIRAQGERRDFAVTSNSIPPPVPQRSKRRIEHAPIRTS
jgi:hypothetical protein